MASSGLTGMWYHSKLYQLYMKIPPDTVLGRWYIGRWYIGRYAIEYHIIIGLHPQHILTFRNFLRNVALDWRKKFKLRKLLNVSFWRYREFRTWKKSRNSVKFRGISRNYMTWNSAEFRRNFNQFRTEYGIDGSKKKQTEFCVDGIPWTP
jgi:hypothetical protein